MRIAINGWFLDQIHTGSGQYLTALAEWLPRVGDGHEFILVTWGLREGETQGGGGAEAWGQGTHQRISESANRRIGESANQRIGESRKIPSAVRHACTCAEAEPRASGGQGGPKCSLFAIRTPFDRFSPNLAKLWFEQIAFPLACRRLRGDVAFVPYWGSPWWSPCPVVVTIHDLIPLLLPRYQGGLLQRAYTWLVSWTARRAAAVLTDSEASKRDIVAHLGIPGERVHAIHLAADPRYRPVTDPATLAAVRAKYNLPAGPFVLYLGGFDARKNVVRTIEAYARLVARGQRSEGRGQGAGVRGQSSEVRLVIAGKLPEADSAFAPDPRPVVERLGLTGRVHFTGWVDEADKPALYSLAAATVFISEYEGFGLPVLEAMGCEGEIGLAQDKETAGIRDSN
ncbi:MAG: glycosyltransferase family 4 protein [Anaerolineae bacterium]